MVSGVIIARTSVATFIRMIAAAPRSTAKPNPRVVAIAPNTRASTPIDRHPKKNRAESMPPRRRSGAALSVRACPGSPHALRIRRIRPSPLRPLFMRNAGLSGTCSTDFHSRTNILNRRQGRSSKSEKPPFEPWTDSHEARLRAPSCMTTIMLCDFWCRCAIKLTWGWMAGGPTFLRNRNRPFFASDYSCQPTSVC